MRTMFWSELTTVAVLPRINAALEIIIPRPATVVSSDQNIVRIDFYFAAVLRVVRHLEIPPAADGVGHDQLLVTNRYPTVGMRENHLHRPVRRVENLRDARKCSGADIHIATEHVCARA